MDFIGIHVKPLYVVVASHVLPMRRLSIPALSGARQRGTALPSGTMCLQGEISIRSSRRRAHLNFGPWIGGYASGSRTGASRTTCTSCKGSWLAKVLPFAALCGRPGIAKRWSVRSLPHPSLLLRNPHHPSLRRSNLRRRSLRPRRMKDLPRTCSRCPEPRRATAQ